MIIMNIEVWFLGLSRPVKTLTLTLLLLHECVEGWSWFERLRVLSECVCISDRFLPFCDLNSVLRAALLQFTPPSPRHHTVCGVRFSLVSVDRIRLSSSTNQFQIISVHL